MAGITCDSILKLAPRRNFAVVECRLDINEVLEDIALGNIVEVFGCGTAAVIAPIGKLGFLRKDYIVNNNKLGSTVKMLHEDLTNIQYGQTEDLFGWVQTL